ncbi:MAG: type IV pilin protein [bacterium]
MLSGVKNRKGFTLIELMIVVVIIGVLAALAIPRFMAATGKAKKSEAKTVLKQLYQLERAYFQENDQYVAGANKAALVATDLGFDDPCPSGDCRYDYSVTVAGSTFTATATELADADGDGTPNETLTMDHNGAEGGDWQ